MRWWDPFGDAVLVFPCGPALFGQWVVAAAADALDGLVAATAGNDGLQLNLAVNYSARADVRLAAERIARGVADGSLAAEDIDEQLVSSYLSTGGMPDPDLLIRPGGEYRLSNFLLYQLAGAELYLSGTFWPDFDAGEFEQALAFFRERTAADAAADGGP